MMRTVIENATDTAQRQAWNVYKLIYMLPLFKKMFKNHEYHRYHIQKKEIMNTEIETTLTSLQPWRLAVRSWCFDALTVIVYLR